MSLENEMTEAPTLESICMPSEDVVAREIEGDVVIVPLAAGIGDADDELYTLNETGRDVWQKLDGQLTIGGVAAALAEEYDAPRAQLEADVLGFAAEMVRRGILMVRP
jgi:hypothetical protein